MTLVVAAPLLCALALLLALVEIEIEGPYGWAEKLPTPYRVSGRAARLFGLVMGGKPLTGYNLCMFTATLLAFHLPFAFAAKWTAARELVVLAAWVSWSAVWDLLWFLLNPAYGWRRFRPGGVWWHRRWLWRLPLDYWFAAAASLVLALAAQIVVWMGSPASNVASGGASPLLDQAALLLVFAAWAAVVALLAPWYRRLYVRTHTAGFDERDRVPITPPPGEAPPGEALPGEAPPAAGAARSRCRARRRAP